MIHVEIPTNKQDFSVVTFCHRSKNYTEKYHLLLLLRCISCTLSKVIWILDFWSEVRMPTCPCLIMLEICWLSKGNSTAIHITEHLLSIYNTTNGFESFLHQMIFEDCLQCSLPNLKLNFKTGNLQISM